MRPGAKPVKTTIKIQTTRTATGSRLKYSPIPPQTPSQILLVWLLVKDLAADGVLAAIRIYYITQNMKNGNEAVAMIVVSSDGKEIAIAKKAIREGKYLSGQWHVPGETKNNGEDDLDAVRRGAGEELGLVVNGFIYFGEHETPRGTTVRWYQAMVVGSEELRVGGDLEEARWENIGSVRNAVSPLEVDLWPKMVREFFGIS